MNNPTRCELTAGQISWYDAAAVMACDTADDRAATRVTSDFIKYRHNFTFFSAYTM